MDVTNACMVLLVMVNKDLRVEKPCNACEPTMMLKCMAQQIYFDSTKRMLVIDANL